MTTRILLAIALLVSLAAALHFKHEAERIEEELSKCRYQLKLCNARVEYLQKSHDKLFKACIETSEVSQ